jgi:hypothetical protein
MKISIVTYSLMWLGKLRKFWKFGVSRSSERAFGHAPLPWRVSTSSVPRLLTLILIQSIFMPWELPEFTWKSTGNLPEIAHEQLLGQGVLHPPRSLRPWSQWFVHESFTSVAGTWFLYYMQLSDYNSISVICEKSVCLQTRQVFSIFVIRIDQ